MGPITVKIYGLRYSFPDLADQKLELLVKPVKYFNVIKRKLKTYLVLVKDPIDDTVTTENGIALRYISPSEDSRFFDGSYPENMIGIFTDKSDSIPFGIYHASITSSGNNVWSCDLIERQDFVSNTQISSTIYIQNLPNSLISKTFIAWRKSVSSCQSQADLVRIKALTDTHMLVKTSGNNWSVFVDNHVEKVLYKGKFEGETSATQLDAVARVLELMPRSNRVSVHSNVHFFIRGMKDWIWNWLKNGWQKASVEKDFDAESGPKPVTNQQQWKALIEVICDRELIVSWHEDSSMPRTICDYRTEDLPMLERATRDYDSLAARYSSDRERSDRKYLRNSESLDDFAMIQGFDNWAGLLNALSEKVKQAKDA